MSVVRAGTEEAAFLLLLVALRLRRLSPPDCTSRRALLVGRVELVFPFVWWAALPDLECVRCRGDTRSLSLPELSLDSPPLLVVGLGFLLAG